VDKQDKARKMLSGYYAQIKNIVDNIGRILNHLDKTGQADNTLVVLLADHGEMGGSHGLHNKEIFYDEAIRILLFMRLPGELPSGNIYSEIVSGLDIYPTCAGICDLPMPSDLQGIDLSPTLKGLKGKTRTET
jgi:arylsulfatase A-like enzyme